MIENERKFLVSKEKWDQKVNHADIEKTVKIEQYYISENDPEVRIRKRNGGESHKLTIKRGGSRQIREENETVVNKHQFKELKRSAVSKIEKNRCYLKTESGFVSVDFFKGKDLILLEMENTEEDKLSWAGEEVTEDPAYYNSNLALSLK